MRLRDTVDFARADLWSVLATIRRQLWAAMHVTRQDFFACAVLEGGVEL